MHVEPETKVLFAMLNGFQLADESQIPKLKRAGKSYAVVQLTTTPESAVSSLVGDSKAFDRAIANVVDIARGLSHSNKGVEVNLSRSVFCSLRDSITKVTALEHENSKKETEIRTKKAELDRAKYEIKAAELRREETSLRLLANKAEEKNEKFVKAEKQLLDLMGEVNKLFNGSNEEVITKIKWAIAEKQREIEGANKFDDMLSRFSEEPESPAK